MIPYQIPDPAAAPILRPAAVPLTSTQGPGLPLPLEVDNGEGFGTLGASDARASVGALPELRQSYRTWRFGSAVAIDQTLNSPGNAIRLAMGVSSGGVTVLTGVDLFFDDNPDPIYFDFGLINNSVALPAGQLDYKLNIQFSKVRIRSYLGFYGDVTIFANPLTI